jgi:hypothetical protein
MTRWPATSGLAIAGRLSSGAYALELTIDDRAAGIYPFTVDP